MFKYFSSVNRKHAKKYVVGKAKIAGRYLAPKADKLAFTVKTVVEKEGGRLLKQGVEQLSSSGNASQYPNIKTVAATERKSIGAEMETIKTPAIDLDAIKCETATLSQVQLDLAKMSLATVPHDAKIDKITIKQWQVEAKTNFKAQQSILVYEVTWRYTTGLFVKKTTAVKTATFAYRLDGQGFITRRLKAVGDEIKAAEPLFEYVGVDSEHYRRLLFWRQAEAKLRELEQREKQLQGQSAELKTRTVEFQSKKVAFQQEMETRWQQLKTQQEQAREQVQSAQVKIRQRQQELARWQQELEAGTIKMTSPADLLPPLIAKLDYLTSDDLAGILQTQLLTLYQAVKNYCQRNHLLPPDLLLETPDDIFRINQIETIMQQYRQKIKRVRQDDAMTDEDKAEEINYWIRLRDAHISQIES